MTPLDIRLRPARSHEAGLIADLLNQATLKLLTKGIPQWRYPCDVQAVQSAIENGEQVVFTFQEQVVAAAKLGPSSGNPAIEAAHPGNLYLSQLAVLPDFQNQNLGKQALKLLIDHVKALGKTLYLDCWADNSKLKQFYAESGFLSLGDFPEEDYYVTVFRVV